MSLCVVKDNGLGTDLSIEIPRWQGKYAEFENISEIINDNTDMNTNKQNPALNTAEIEREKVMKKEETLSCATGTAQEQHQLVTCLVDWLINRLIEEKVDWFIASLVDWLIDWLKRKWIDWVCRWLIDWLDCITFFRILDSATSRFVIGEGGCGAVAGAGGRHSWQGSGHRSRWLDGARRGASGEESLLRCTTTRGTATHGDGRLQRNNLIVRHEV